MNQSMSPQFKVSTVFFLIGALSFLVKNAAQFCESSAAQICGSQSWAFGAAAQYGDVALLLAVPAGLIYFVLSIVKKQVRLQFLAEAVIGGVLLVL